MTHLQTDGAQVFSRWLNEGMTRDPKRPRDLNQQWAKHMVDIATGEASDREPPRKERGKKPVAAKTPVKKIRRASAREAPKVN